MDVEKNKKTIDTCKTKYDLRKCWQNVTNTADREINAIDKLEDNLSFFSQAEKDEIYKIRGAVSSYEICHHKALHRLHILIRSIGSLHHIPK